MSWHTYIYTYIQIEHFDMPDKSPVYRCVRYMYRMSDACVMSRPSFHDIPLTEEITFKIFGSPDYTGLPYIQGTPDFFRETLFEILGTLKFRGENLFESCGDSREFFGEFGRCQMHV